MGVLAKQMLIHVPGRVVVYLVLLIFATVFGIRMELMVLGVGMASVAFLSDGRESCGSCVDMQAVGFLSNCLRVCSLLCYFG